MKTRKENLANYYDSLLEKGVHKFFVDPLAEYRKIFLIIILVMASLLIYYFGGKNIFLRILWLLILIGGYKLGKEYGHKEGFIDGYDRGLDDSEEALRIIKSKKNITLGEALKKVRKENSRVN